MGKSELKSRQMNCPSCGAPVVSEICAYCGMVTGLDTAGADMEYPVLECKAAVVNFWNLWFPMIFAAAFGFAGLVVLIIGIAVSEAMLIVIGLPFTAIGLVSLVMVLRTLLRYLKVKSRGEIIRARVYGYIDDEMHINDRPAQIVKLLVQTPKGPRFILYKLGNTLKPYGINDSIDIMVYREYFMICENKERAQLEM